ncbi:hypothetical protein SAMN04487999_3280 [Leeuwenhoekiella palythoae]|uniref:C1q domain-containing protein n=2 Tax=Leeuwenhoekiella palythoae TaxID=573501 RepID=A0A1M5ZNF8_9FLAO|nr:hypothetical protein DSM01_3074 [Leeuwenhoekiella palythoae]SHI25732.1 hypothetical protein SAMN04487999_3280 [Leeuwenhoekiella palythoae]
MLKLSFLLSLFLLSFISNAQVGIGTTNPAGGSLLDIESAEKGILIPRVDIADLSTQAPVTGDLTSSESLLVYNTNTSTGKGFYYWDGTQWVAVGGNGENIYTTDGTLEENRIVSQEDKTLQFEGNIGRNAISIKRTNNVTETGVGFQNSGDYYDASIFMESGTNQGLVVATGGNNPDVTAVGTTAVFNNDQTTSFSNSISVYQNDANVNDITGRLYSTDDDGILDLYENNSYNHRIAANSSTIFNEQGLNLDFRVETDNSANTLFVDGSSDNVGLSTNTPQEKLHISGNNSTIRVDGLSDTNNAENVTGDFMPVYVDDNGTMVLQPSLVQTYMPVNRVDFLTGNNNTVTSGFNTGASVDRLLLTETITLTQTSLVQIIYFYSVSITRRNGDAITDGAPRLFRGWVTINNTAEHLAYDTGTYTNGHDPDPNSQSNYAAGYYYLNGTSYVELPAGTHTFRLYGRGFGSQFDFQMIFGASNYDRFQIIVHR